MSRAPKAGIKLHHFTTAEAARAILESGFKDGTGSYMTNRLHTGVWLSDVPMSDADGGPDNGVLLEVQLRISARTLRTYEWIEEGKPYREFLIPARIVNAHGSVRKVRDSLLPDPPDSF